MKRGVFISIIIIFLIGICTLEQKLVDNTLIMLKEKTDNLIIIIPEYENIINKEIILKTNELNDFWDKYENLLCFFINHKDMQEMGIELKKMQSYAEYNVKEEYFTSLNLVIHYTDTFNHIMGLSLQNLI